MASVAPKQERIRTLYISSENVDYFDSSERITINLQHSVIPEEGYNLYYALKSIGFNSTAMNISNHQKNNWIRYVITQDWTEVTHKIVRPTDPVEQALYTSGFKFEEITVADRIPTRTVDIQIPDGHYTLHSLFEYLSTAYADRSSPTSSPYIIPSGFYHDYEKVLQPDGSMYYDVQNMIPLKLLWSETPSGFQIELLKQNTAPDKLTYMYGVTDEETLLHVEKLFPNISVFSIEPHPTFPSLFNTLFTNYNSEYSNTPISTPSKTGINPPHAIDFHITRPEGDGAYPLKWQDLKISERGNEKNYNIPDKKFPTDDLVNYHNYVAYYKPVLDPVYVDVEISLPNPSMDEKGEKNRLARIFTLGAKDGNSSLFQQWHNPKQVVISGNSGFSSITLDFISQANKWNFFNLEFTIELDICEMMEEYDLPNNHIVDVNIPATDPISATSAQSSNHPTPLHPHHFNYHMGGIQPMKKSRYI